MGLLSYARQAVEPCSLISIKSRISLCSCPSHFKMVAMSDHEHHMLSRNARDSLVPTPLLPEERGLGTWLEGHCTQLLTLHNI